ncbi:MAG: dihydropteroate synthase [Rhodobacterales bacterium]|nr:dihydropteroate synthase [Rhodobacterales bacterium]
MLHRQPLLLGIVNVTPDSFSDGGQFARADAAIAHGLALIEQGAYALDVGGESTRPGAAPVSAAEEKDRVLPVIRGLLRVQADLKISVDTRKASVARAALQAGAWMVNDVSAGADPQMFSVCAEAECVLILMHMRGTPATMQRQTGYHDLVGEVIDVLQQRIALARAAGVRHEHIIADPGLGFGKALLDNPKLIAAVPRMQSELGIPVLIGASRKRFIGELTQQSNASERVFGSVGAALAAARVGAEWVRVHDVAATQQALAVFNACGGFE